MDATSNATKTTQHCAAAADSTNPQPSIAPLTRPESASPNSAELTTTSAAELPSSRTTCSQPADTPATTSSTPPPPPPSPPPPPCDLDPRIQIELENLNTATDNINRLEIELEEANATFRILLNESTRRLKVLSKKLGTCIEKSRPFHEAAEKARSAQIECQAAAVQFQRAHEHYAAAKETVALAEQRFMSGSHEWKFDNAWQEMLNHATIKVAAAEQHKTECNAEHQRRAAVFSAAEARASQLEDQLRRAVIKSRPYFEEKQICQDQLQTQKERIEELQQCVAQAKRRYAQALKALEEISEEIHRARKLQQTGGGVAVVKVAADDEEEEEEEEENAPQGPREPGVGAERCSGDEMLVEIAKKLQNADGAETADSCGGAGAGAAACGESLQLPSLNYVRELDAVTVAGGANDVDDDDCERDIEADDDDDDVVCVNDADDNATTAPFDDNNDVDVEALRRHVKQLAVRPMEGGDGQQTQDVWESELNATVDRLDRLLMQREHESNNEGSSNSSSKQPTKTLPPQCAATLQPHSDAFPVSMPNTPARRQLLKADPLPTTNVSMRELPLLSRLSNELTATGQRMAAAAMAAAGGGSDAAAQVANVAAMQLQQQRRRSLE